MIYAPFMSRTARLALVLSLAGGALPSVAGATAPATASSLPGVASAVSTTTSTTTTSTTTAPAPLPLPAPVVKPGSASITLLDAFTVGGQRLTVAGRGLHIEGIVKPYVADQKVTLQVQLGRRLIRKLTLGVRRGRRGRFGVFTARVVSPHAGPVTLTALHAHSSAQGRFSATKRYAALSPHAGFGSSGRFVELIQQRLAALHIYIQRTGAYDQGTGLALDAYHRLLRWGTSQTLGPATITALLNGRGRFAIRYPRQGHHAEGNLGRQLLALADGSKVDWIFPISSGKPSTPTILGTFQIYQRTPGYLPDGMYFSSFFSGGYAIHGYDPAPDYPASHGCMRLPISDAIFVYNHVTYGNWVDTYY
jgi:hypothetical protein